MARKLKITLNTDHVETLQVPDKFSLEAALLDSDSDFVVVPAIGGGEYAFRKSHVLAIVKEPKG